MCLPLFIYDGLLLSQPVIVIWIESCPTLDQHPSECHSRRAELLNMGAGWFCTLNRIHNFVIIVTCISCCLLYGLYGPTECEVPMIRCHVCQVFCCWSNAGLQLTIILTIDSSTDYFSSNQLTVYPFTHQKILKNADLNFP